MRIINLSSRRRVAEAIRMILRAEAEEEDRPAADDLVLLLDQWETGTIHGLDPGSPAHTEKGQSSDTLYG